MEQINICLVSISIRTYILECLTGIIVFSIRKHCLGRFNFDKATSARIFGCFCEIFYPPEMAILELPRFETTHTETETIDERFDMEMNTAINNGKLQKSETQDDNEAVIDKQVLVRFWKNLDEDDSLIQEMVTIFLQDAPKQLSAAHQALANQDSKELGRIAHTLKGSSSYYGAKRLAIPCTELEDNCEVGNLSGASSLVAQLEKEFEAVREVLKSMVLQLPLMRGTR